MHEDQNAVFPTEPNAEIAAAVTQYDDTSMGDFVPVLYFLIKNFSVEHSGGVGPERSFGELPDGELMIRLTLGETEFEDDLSVPDEEWEGDPGGRGLIEVEFAGEPVLQYACTFPEGTVEERDEKAAVIGDNVTDALADWLTRSAELDPKVKSMIMESVKMHLKPRPQEPTP